MQREQSQRERIKALGYSLKGFAELLNEKNPGALFVINNVTLSRALHYANGTRSERWLRDEVEKTLRAEEKRRAAR